MNLINLATEMNYMGMFKEAGDDDERESSLQFESRVELDEKSSDVLNALLFRGDGLYEIEVHQLAYLIDVFAVEKYQTPVLGVAYTPNPNGVYSADLSLKLDKLAQDDHVRSIPELYDGDLIAVYNRTEPVKSERGLKRLVDEVLTQTSPSNSEQLTEVVKNHSARSSTTYGELIDLEAYGQTIQTSEADRLFDVSHTGLPEEL